MTPENYAQLKKNSKNDKLFIGTGCSFTQGQGGLKDSVWESYNWNIPNTHCIAHLEAVEIEGSWVTQFCKNHYPDWTPINLGARGAGNYAAAQSLTSLYPELNLEDTSKEKIVVFMLSGPERYSIINSEWGERFHGVFQSIWPDPNSDNPLWRAYATDMYSEKQTMLLTYFAIKQVQDWCKLYNAKLMLVSAFDFSYVARWTPGKVWDTINLPWDLPSQMWKPEGHPSAFHMLLNNDGFSYDVANGGYWDGLNYNDAYPKGTPHVSRCCHPNYKGHAYIANEMRKEFIDRGWLS